VTVVTGADVVIAAWRSLDSEQREAAFLKIAELRVIEAAGQDSDATRMIQSLRRVAECVDGAVSPGDYKRVREQLVAAGEDIAPLHEQIKHYGRWRAAKDALALSETETPRRIDARFRFRRLGKVWRYTDETLRATFEACVNHYGRPPTLAEFEWWREQQIQKAKAKATGDIDGEHLPSAGPYRKRWDTWERTIANYGHDDEEATSRWSRP
jgi:hypothetical protein